MKTQLKDGIWIEGFDKLSEVYAFKDNMCIVGEAVPYIYIGKTSEISEELAKTCAEILAKTTMGNFYRNYQYNKPQPVSFTKCKAKESIQSACSQEYCIIYKTK